MTKCPYCSEPVPDKTATCPACAEPLGGTDSQPPTPPQGQHESKRSSTPKRSKTKVVCLLILAVGVLAYCVHLAVQYRAFSTQLTVAKNIRISDSRQEVMYRLGMPTHVVGAPATGDWGFGQAVYRVAAVKSGNDAMPSATKVEDYSEWFYEEVSINVRLTIEFNKSGLVESLHLDSDIDQQLHGWGPVAGLYSGDSEERVLRLGVPSKKHFQGVAKTIEYDDLGLKIWLTKGKAYGVKLKGVPQNSPAVFWRYIRQ